MPSEEIKRSIRQEFERAKDGLEYLNALRQWISKELSPVRGDPVDNVQWVPMDLVQANDYNPNAVALNEMRLLHTSIAHDGYTQPIVTIWDRDLMKHVISGRVPSLQCYAQLRGH